MRAALYLRTSTTEQTTENQKLDLQQMCQARKLEVVSIYEDFGHSGISETRPALSEMLTAAKRGEVDCIVTWSYDRIFRSLKHLLTIIDELEAVGVRLITFKESQDTGTPQGRLLVQILGSLAEFERSIIRERIAAGLRRAKKQGKQLGRPRIDFNISLARELRADGQSYDRIAQEVGASVGTVHKALTQQTAVP